MITFQLESQPSPPCPPYSFVPVCAQNIPHFITWLLLLLLHPLPIRLKHLFLCSFLQFRNFILQFAMERKTKTTTMGITATNVILLLSPDEIPFEEPFAVMVGVLGVRKGVVVVLVVAGGVNELDVLVDW